MFETHTLRRQLRPARGAMPRRPAGPAVVACLLVTSALVLGAPGVVAQHHPVVRHGSAPHAGAGAHPASSHSLPAHAGLDLHALHRWLAHALPDLGLDDSQRAAVDDLHQRCAPRVTAASQRGHELHDLLARQIHAEVLDVGAVRQIAADWGAEQEELLVSTAECVHELMQILDPEQRESLHRRHAEATSGHGD